MKLFYADRYEIPLPDNHRFPRSKNRLAREAMLRDGLIGHDELELSPLAERGDIIRVHTPAYVDAVLEGTLPRDAMRRIGMPWSPHLVLRSRATLGGAVAAMREAMREGFSGQLAGGTHHAHADFGSGFCVFNDFALAATTALAEGLASRVAIVDLDVHQGDGNAAIFADDPSVFVFSLHAEKNFPFRKAASDLDIGLPDATEDRAYLDALHDGLDAVLGFRPDLVLYQSGVDPLVHDKLGRLSLTYEGLAARDRLVFETFSARGIPVSIGVGGGYCDPIEQTVAAILNTVAAARAVYRL
ncbi:MULTISPECIES: histone deacetylase [Rhodomicrobium]|uniref:histone deacetylase family protein n=1 Tax=Rhodomicrobium TaxID=1068 RepID=UPI000B4BE1FB|nr:MULTISPECIES: histone deacetylase [Rhodomicrobium]